MNALKIFTIILFVLLTSIVLAIRPGMHQPVIIENEDFKIYRESDTLNYKDYVNVQPENTVVAKNVQVNVQPQTETVNKYVDSKSDVGKVNEKRVNIDNQTGGKAAKNNDSQLEILQRIIKNTENQPSKPDVVTPDITPKPKEVKPQPEKTVAAKKNENPYMTEEEEIIAWNKWRSNIQNYIMKNSGPFDAPIGTIFSFSCVVDKFGNVSNIKVMSSNPNYMTFAKNNIKPVIAGLQNKPLLNFPRGTKRTTTVFTGFFAISVVERYSTPEDYHDFERIIKYVQ